MEENRKLREQLAFHLSGQGAHISFDGAVEGLPYEMTGKTVPSLAHTAWQLVYHLQIAQSDILEFCRGADHVSPQYPSGYWPQNPAPVSEKQWEDTVQAFQTDLNAMIDRIRDPDSDLFAPFAHGSGQNLLREAILITDHNAYHVGQLVDIRMLLGIPVRDW